MPGELSKILYKLHIKKMPGPIKEKPNNIPSKPKTKNKQIPNRKPKRRQSKTNHDERRLCRLPLYNQTKPIKGTIKNGR